MQDPIGVQMIGLASGAHPSSSEVRGALDHILASQAFSDSPQLRAFLTYVVEEVLAGRGSEIKGYTIATLALGRPVTFDPQSDPIVRVQAGRVRQALTEYYAAQTDRTVVIHLDRGSYAPRFSRTDKQTTVGISANDPDARTVLPDTDLQQKDAHPGSPTGPATGHRWRLIAFASVLLLGLFTVVALVQWRQPSLPPAVAVRLSPESFYPTLHVEADVLGTFVDVSMTASRIRDAIARFDDLVVVGDTADEAGVTPAAPPVRRGWNLVLRITGAITENSRIRINARLLDRADQRLIWSREYEPFPLGLAGDDARTAITRSITTTIAQPYGVIHAHVRGVMEQALAANDPYGCVVAGLDYWLTNDRDAHLAARECIARRLAIYPSFGPLHAQMAYLHLEEYRHGYNPLPGDARARAIASAQNAVRFRPASARSQQSLMAALFATDDLDGAFKAAGEALALNPYDTEIIADVGSYRVMAGDFEQGLNLLNNAIDLNPSPPDWVVTYRALALYMLGRPELSGPMVRALEDTGYLPARIALILAAFQSRDAEAAHRHLARFKAQHAAIAGDPEQLLRRMNFQASVTARVMSDYNRALSWITELPPKK